MIAGYIEFWKIFIRLQGCLLQCSIDKLAFERVRYTYDCHMRVEENDIFLRVSQQSGDMKIHKTRVFQNFSRERLRVFNLSWSTSYCQYCYLIIWTVVYMVLFWWRNSSIPSYIFIKTSWLSELNITPVDIIRK